MQHIFYHDDMDGVASLYMYCTKVDRVSLASTTYPITYSYKDDIFSTVLAGDEVVFLDFCPRVGTVKGTLSKCEVEIYDHHEGAKNAVTEIRELSNVAVAYLPSAKGCCQMFDSKPVPLAIKLIGNRDVWDFSLEGTREFHAWCGSQKPSSDFNYWLKTFEAMEKSEELVHMAIAAGRPLVEKHDATIKKAVDSAAEIWFKGQRVLASNSYDNISELGNALASAGSGLGMTYYVTGGETPDVRISFRSVERSACTALKAAQHLGGGGHKHAAGANMQLDDFWILFSVWLKDLKGSHRCNIKGFVFDLLWNKEFPPLRSTKKSRAYDLRSTETHTIMPGEVYVFPTGVSWNVIDTLSGFVLEAQIVSRSGLAKKHKVWLAKGVGTVDEDYKGIIGVDLINCGTEPYEVKAGDRIAQMIFRTDVDFDIPELTDDEERGNGGFGSTGK